MGLVQITALAGHPSSSTATDATWCCLCVVMDGDRGARCCCATALLVPSNENVIVVSQTASDPRHSQPLVLRWQPWQTLWCFSFMCHPARQWGAWSSLGELMIPISLAPSTGFLSLTKVTGRSPWTGNEMTADLCSFLTVVSRETHEPRRLSAGLTHHGAGGQGTKPQHDLVIP